MATPNLLHGNRLEALTRIVREVDSAANLKEALKIVVTRTREVIACDVCSVYFTEHERRRHVVAATDGLASDVTGHMQVGFGKGLVGLVAESGRPINLDRVPEELDDPHEPPQDSRVYHSFLGVPVTHKRRIQGVLLVRRREAVRFDDADEAYLVTLAAQLGGAIAYARISGELDRISLREHNEPQCIDGLSGAPGYALGQGMVCFNPADLERIPDRHSNDPGKEKRRLRQAIDAIRQEIGRLGADLSGSLSSADRALFDAYVLMLDSPEILQSASASIEQGNWAPGALRHTIETHARHFEHMDEPYLQARAEDIRELGTRILAHLTGEFAERAEYPTHTLLIGSRLSAFDLGRVPVAQLRGIISGEGSGLSHVAILARALGIPAVMGVGELPLERLDGESLILDGNSGQVYVRPDAALRWRYRKRIEAEQALAKELEGMRDLPTETPDGMPVSLYANAGLTADIPLGNMAGCAGIGLFRSELPFMRYERFPSEQEQFGIYRQVLAQMAPLPVNLRSLDAGGDKPLPYLPLQETNPALGWRGVRLTLDHPEIFLVQLRAALRADIGLGNLRLLLPMISGLDELEQARELLGRACRQLQEEGHAVTPPPLGVMIEVPAAVHQAGLLARQVDFVCVGSNDLIQYLLAADRNNPRVSQRLDPLHPAMLKAMRQILKAVHRAGRTVMVCGQMAADPACALVLLGMGFDGLSVNPNALPRLKWTVHSVSAECMRSLASQVMRCQRPGPARRLLDRTLLGAGLGRLRASVNDSSG